MRTHPAVVRTYVLRGAGTWLATRAFASGILLLARENVLSLAVTTVAEIIAISVILELFQSHVRRERAFLGNLGVPPWMSTAMVAVPATLGELALRLAGRLL